MESRDQRYELERDPRPAPRILAPLFDRLTAPPDPSKEGEHPFRSMAVKEAFESVRTELKRLLNSRTILQDPRRWPGGLTSINYGLPDFSHVSAMDLQARSDLALRLARIIEAFEPRLSQVRVTVDPHPSGTRFLTGEITAKLKVDMIPEPIAFELFLPSAAPEFG